MLVAVRVNLGWCEALIMAAAVADWRPVTVSDQKLKKHTTRLVLELERTPDVLVEVLPLKGSRVYVGFAAETEDLEVSAEKKLRAKGLDLIVANDVTKPGSGFGTDTNEVMFIARGEPRLALPLMAKTAVAERIVDWVVRHRS